MNDRKEEKETLSRDTSLPDLERIFGPKRTSASEFFNLSKKKRKMKRTFPSLFFEKLVIIIKSAELQRKSCKAAPAATNPLRNNFGVHFKTFTPPRFLTACVVVEYAKRIFYETTALNLLQGVIVLTNLNTGGSRYLINLATFVKT